MNSDFPKYGTDEWEGLPEFVKILNTYEEGFDDFTVCKRLKFSKSHFDQRFEREEDFKKVIEFGRTLERAWWMEQGREGLWDKNFVSSVYSLHMKNRFGWAEKAETKASDFVRLEEMSKEQVLEAISKMQPAIQSQLENRPLKAVKI